MYDLFAMHYPKNSTFFLWQPLSHMFMHGDLTHILFNMFGLWMFGTPLEQMWGKQKFIFFRNWYWQRLYYFITFKSFKIYVTFSFPNCDPLSFLNPLRLINEQLKLSITRIISLNV